MARTTGYLIPFTPIVFVSHCRCRPNRVLSLLGFFPISMHFTVPPEIPYAPTVLQLELANAYSPNTGIASSLRKEVHEPWAFYLHAALLRQDFSHCGEFLTTASCRSLGRVSVPVWLIILSDQLLIIALSSYALPRPFETPKNGQIPFLRNTYKIRHYKKDNGNPTINYFIYEFHNNRNTCPTKIEFGTCYTLA
uniref:Unknow protein n=1 Tax=Solanum tuberosum TaxID=4113 RepID=M0ZL37_SOLTU